MTDERFVTLMGSIVGIFILIFFIIIGGLLLSVPAYGAEVDTVPAKIAIPSGVGAAVCGGNARLRGLSQEDTAQLCIVAPTVEQLGALALKAAPPEQFANIPDGEVPRTDVQALNAYLVACAYSYAPKAQSFLALLEKCIEVPREQAIELGTQIRLSAFRRVGAAEL